MRRLLLSAGEASGDAYGGALLTEMLRLHPALPVKALAGDATRRTGVAMIGDSSAWGAISIAQGLRLYPRVLRAYYRLKRELSRGEPGLFLPIDFGYANLRLARHAKSRGWSVLYFVPPSSWRRDRQGRDVPAVSDVVVTPFPWSAEMLRAMGADARFFGHPIKGLAPAPFHGERSGVALLPGSRASEIETLLPLFAAASRGVEGPIRIPVPGAREALARRLWSAAGGDPAAEIGGERAWTALARSRAALVCSGTATLEAALARTPFAIAYRLSRATLLEARLIRYRPPRFVGLPNIILDRPVVPELLQDNATPERLRGELDRLLAGDPAQLAAFDELDALLGPDDAIARTAEIASAMLRV